MESTRDIFKLIQLPGSKPGDANWETARWGFSDWDSLFKTMFVDDEEQCDVAKASEAFQRQIDAILAPFKNDPNQTKITSYFHAKKDNRIEPVPTTSAAYLNSINANSTTISEHLRDDDDSLVLDAVESHESQAKKFKLRVETELFWAKQEKDHKIEHHQITHRHNLAKIKLIDRADNERMKNVIKDVFWPIHQWPAFAVEILMTPTFNYNERLTLATFFHGNGMRDAILPIQLFKYYNQHWKKARNHHNGWKQKFYKFKQLFPYLNKAKDFYDPEYYRIGETYYYYSMIAKHMLYYNGNKRKKGNHHEFLVKANNY